MKFRLLAFVVGATIAVAACAPAAPPAAPKEEIPRGGTLTFAIWQEPATLNAFHGTQTVITIVLNAVVEGLVDVDPDGNYVPELAEEVPTLKNGQVKLSPDGKKMDVTYKLKKGIVWSDGKPFTSADVKFTWQAVMKDPKVTSREGYDKIEAIDTPDDLTVVVKYKEIYAPYLTRFGAILPKHVLEGVEDFGKHEYSRKPLGTGPFKIVEFKAAESITAERNENYRVKGKPYLDRIIFRSVPSREVAIAQLKAGEAQGMWNLLEAQVPDVEKAPDVKLIIVPQPTVERLEFNLSKPANPADPKVAHPVLGDLKVRRALLFATPKQQIIDKLLFGKATVGNTALGGVGWAVPKDLKQEGYDTTRAKQLLDEAGWKPGADGIRVKDGVRASLVITTTTGDRVREQVEQILVDEWKQIGVELKIRNVPSSVLFGTWAANSPRKKGDFDINMYASTPDIDPHSTINQRFHSDNIPRVENKGAGFNYNRFSSAEADKLIGEVGSTVDQEKRKELYRRILQIVNDNVLNVWLYNRSDIDAFRENVGGYRGSSWNEITWTTEDWFIRR